MYSSIASNSACGGVPTPSSIRTNPMKRGISITPCGSSVVCFLARTSNGYAVLRHPTVEVLDQHLCSVDWDMHKGAHGTDGPREPNMRRSSTSTRPASAPGDRRGTFQACRALCPLSPGPSQARGVKPVPEPRRRVSSTRRSHGVKHGAMGTFTGWCVDGWWITSQRRDRRSPIWSLALGFFARGLRVRRNGRLDRRDHAHDESGEHDELDEPSNKSGHASRLGARTRLRPRCCITSDRFALRRPFAQPFVCLRPITPV